MTRILLNTALCQYTKEASKTKNAINYLKSIYAQHYLNTNNDEAETHNITVVFTNNSLEEKCQWKIRTKNDLDLNIWDLSSKNDSDFTSVEKLSKAIMEIVEYQQLPHIIILCTNRKRIDDFLYLHKTFGARRSILDDRTGFRYVRFGLMLDEADKNIALIADRLLSHSNLKQDQVQEQPHLSYLMFITATPFDSFWSKLESQGIESCEFGWIKEQLIANGQDLELIQNGYRMIIDHQYIGIEENSKNPVQYAEYVLGRIPGGKKRHIIFAPAGQKCSSHDQMASVFSKFRYVCLLHNGKNRKFIFPDLSQITIKEYKKKHGIDGELRDVLVDFANRYPTVNIGITGFLTIERGITFNTTGFQFTHMIFSDVHAKNKASLIQLFGRGNGSKEFVDVFKIVCPRKIWNEVITVTGNIKQILEVNEGNLSRTDFKKIRDSHFRKKTVPMVIGVTQCEFETSVKKEGKRYDKPAIYNLLCRQPEFARIMNIYTLDNLKQVSMPHNQESYTKKIIDSCRHAINGEKYLMEKVDDWTRPNWWLYLDEREHRFIIIRTVAEI